MAKTEFRGVTRKSEIRSDTRRDDVRTFPQRVVDSLDTPSGVVVYFGSLVTFLLTVGLYIPFSGEAVLLVALLTYLARFRYKNRWWEVPFRVPAYLHGKLGQVFKDASTGGGKGAGEFYMGLDKETNEEVWAASNDLRTHRLVVGTTGSGKTEEILGNMFNAMVLDSGAMMVDGKADPKTYASLFRICRVLGREEDVLLINYIMGGRDFASGLDARRTNTYNPLSAGSAAMKAELLVSLLDTSSGGGSDMWQGRAISFLEAITPPLSFLADRGLLLFNSKLLSDFYLLQNIENLVWFGIFKDQNGKLIDLKNGPDEFRRIYSILMDSYFGALILYLENLPAYEAPKKPHRPSRMDDDDWRRFDDDFKRKLAERNSAAMDSAEEKGQNKKNAGDSRAEVLKQHGFITMQLVRATGNLTFNYGHIYSDEIGEVSYRDVLLNRRILLVLLPALERSKASMEQLGKMAVSAIKGVLATLLDTPLEGSYRKIIEGRPSNAKIPYSIICDEYGYYVVPGFAVAPAQARSYGVSLTFGAQDVPSLSKADKAEGEATWENTNLRLLGRMTGGEKSETYEKFAGAAGQAMVQVSKTMQHSRGSLDKFRLSDDSTIENVSRLDLQDLSQQQDGEFHLVVGTKADGAGGARVVRFRAFYTGDVPEPDALRLVPYVQVKAFSETERAVIARNEALANRLSRIPSSEVRDRIEKLSAYENVRGDIIAQFLGEFGHLDYEPSGKEIAAWIDRYDAEAVKRRRDDNTKTVKREVMRLVEEVAAQSMETADSKALHGSAAEMVLDWWEAYDPERNNDTHSSVEVMSKKTQKGHRLVLANQQ